MTSHVFANGREVLCGASTGQVLAAFPDVCLSPPGPPAGPIPIPYPNFAKAADVANGSRQVFIKGKPLIKRETSYIKKITGDEAATRNFGGSVITHTITGTAWFQSWSPNVYVEGEEVVRHLDLCTTNHTAQAMGSSPPQAAMASMTPPSGSGGPCDASRGEIAEKCDSEEKKACPDATKLEQAKTSLKEERERLTALTPKPAKGSIKTQTQKQRDAVRDEYQEYAKQIARNPCRRALRCELTPFAKSNCCPPQTPHHVVDVCSFLQSGQRPLPKAQQQKRPGCSGYDEDAALCVCAEGGNNTGTHGLLHLKQRQWSQGWKDQQKQQVAAGNQAAPWTLSTAVECGVTSITKVFPLSNCDEDCLKQKLLDNHQRMGIGPGQEIACRPSGAKQQDFDAKWDEFCKAERSLNDSLVKRNTTQKPSRG
jgi:hypothetical protein